MAAIVLGTASRGTTASDLIYAFGSVVCHQRADRSFALDGTPLPVCARCTGLYLSGALGALVAWLGAPRAPKRSRDILIAAAIPTLMSVAVEWTGFSQVSNSARALAAATLGVAAGWIFVRALRSEGDAL